MTDVKLFYVGTMQKSFPVKKGGERLGKIRPGNPDADFLTLSGDNAAWLEATQPGLWARTRPAPAEPEAVEAEPAVYELLTPPPPRASKTLKTAPES